MRSGAVRHVTGRSSRASALLDVGSDFRAGRRRREAPVLAFLKAIERKPDAKRRAGGVAFASSRLGSRTAHDHETNPVKVVNSMS